MSKFILIFHPDIELLNADCSNILFMKLDPFIPLLFSPIRRMKYALSCGNEAENRHFSACLQSKGEYTKQAHFYDCLVNKL